jgi:hypothetical protein
MAPDNHDRRERIRLPAADDENTRNGAAWRAAAPSPTAHERRDRGIRESRTAANWTAAALIAGVAAATGYFAHHPATQAVAAAQYTQSGTASAGATVHGQGGHAAISQPVATSGGSGVTAGSGGAGGGLAGRRSGWRDS